MTLHAHHATCTATDGTTLAFGHYPSSSHGAPRLALVHSLALDRHVWDGVIDALTGAADVVAADCRGHGGSSRMASAFTADARPSACHPGAGDDSRH
jgi:3-oxoadipate enol-lactonase